MDCKRSNKSFSSTFLIRVCAPCCRKAHLSHHLHHFPCILFKNTIKNLTHIAWRQHVSPLMRFKIGCRFCAFSIGPASYPLPYFSAGIWFFNVHLSFDTYNGSRPLPKSFLGEGQFLVNYLAFLVNTFHSTTIQSL